MSRNYFQHSSNYKTLNGLRGGINEQRFDQSLIPNVTDTYDLGSGTLKWQEVFANKIEAIGGESRFSSVDVTNTMRTNNLVVTGNTTYNLLSANDASIATLDVTNLNAQGTEILVGDDMRLGADEILYTNKIRSNPTGGTVTVYDNLTVLGTLSYTLPPAATGVFGTLSDTEIGDLVTDPLDASPPEAADSNLQPTAERVLSAPTINATQWISTPFLTLMGLAQTDKLKVTSDKIPSSKTDYNNSAFWNEGGAILQGRTYIDAECIPNSLSVVDNATVGGTLGVTGATTLASLNVSGATKLGSDPPDGSPYSSVNGKLRVQSTHAHTTSDHSGTLMLLDNSSTQNNVNTGKGGSVVFAGPYHDFGTDFYGAAGRVRGITNVGSYGGSLTFETAGGGGNLDRRMTIDSSGNIGVGTTTPSRLLDVNGTLIVNGVATFNNNLTCAGYIGINNTLPTVHLDVGGSIKASGNSQCAGYFLGQRFSTVGGVNYLSLTDGGTNVLSGRLNIAENSSSLSVTPRKRQASDVDGWVTLDPDGGSNTVDTTGVAVLGQMDVSGNFKSLKTGNATSTTSGPNVFSGGLAVTGTSYFETANITNIALTGEMNITAGSSSLTVTPGLRDGVATDGWTQFQPAGGSGSKGSFFVNRVNVGGDFDVAGETIMGYISTRGGTSVDLGYDVAGKEVNAGRIGYELFGLGTLDIVGAGTTSTNRTVRIFDDLNVQQRVSTATLAVSGGANYGGTLTISTTSAWPADAYTYGLIRRTYSGGVPSINDGPIATDVAGYLGSTAGNRKSILLYNESTASWVLGNGTGMTRIGPSVTLTNGEGAIMTLYVVNATTGYVTYVKAG